MTTTSIREGLVDLLKKADIVGSSVFNSRLPNFLPDELPAISVYTGTRNDTRMGLSAEIYKRSETHYIDLVIAGSEDAGMAAECDSMADAVVYAILTNRPWMSQFEQVPSVSVEWTSSVETDARRAGAHITVDVQYSMIFELDYKEDYTCAVDLKTDQVDCVSATWVLDEGKSDEEDNDQG